MKPQWVLKGLLQSTVCVNVTAQWHILNPLTLSWVLQCRGCLL